jgi:tRNA U38,U39,U40 pseudouridine synthase TruA
MQFDAVHNDLALLEIFQAVDAPDEAALTAAGRTDKYNHLTFIHL